MSRQSYVSTLMEAGAGGSSTGAGSDSLGGGETEPSRSEAAVPRNSESSFTSSKHSSVGKCGAEYATELNNLQKQVDDLKKQLEEKDVVSAQDRKAADAKEEVIQRENIRLGC